MRLYTLREPSSAGCVLSRLALRRPLGRTRLGGPGGLASRACVREGGRRGRSEARDAGREELGGGAAAALSAAAFRRPLGAMLGAQCDRLAS